MYSKIIEKLTKDEIQEIIALVKDDIFFFKQRDKDTLIYLESTGSVFDELAYLVEFRFDKVDDNCIKGSIRPNDLYCGLFKYEDIINNYKYYNTIQLYRHIIQNFLIYNKDYLDRGEPKVLFALYTFLNNTKEDEFIHYKVLNENSSDTNKSIIFKALIYNDKEYRLASFKDLSF